MGTNFYWHPGRNPTWKHSEQGIHVGKRSGGWSFGFRAWGEGFTYPAFDIDFGDGQGMRHFPESQHEGSPFETTIRSRQDWVTKVFVAPGVLVSEYGEESPDVLEWLKTMEGPTPDQIAKEESYTYRGPVPYPQLFDAGPRKDHPKEWRDAEGFRFYEGEFC